MVEAILVDNVEPTAEMSRAERRVRTSELFRALDTTTDSLERDRLREQIATLNMGVAEAVAHRYRGHGEMTEDLEQVAYLGLVKAVNGFDSRYHKNFLAYAVPTISGEVKKHFRDRCWTVRPPRRLQELQRKIALATEDLSQQRSQQPAPAELADALSVSEDEVREALAADGCFTPASLDVRVGDAESTPVGDLIGEDDRGFARAETHVLLAPVMRELDDRDRDIIELRFFHDWTQERIAEQLGITQMQVSRLIARIMRSLLAQIDDSA